MSLSNSLGLLGRKVGMMRIFTDDGDAVPVTVLDVSDNRVTQVKTDETDGYSAIQVTAWIPDYGAIEVAITTDEMEGENLWGVVYALRNGKDISKYRPVEILTPTGGARFLPEGSTVLDAVASTLLEQGNLDREQLLAIMAGNSPVPAAATPARSRCWRYRRQTFPGSK